MRSVRYCHRQAVNRTLYDIDAEELLYTKGQSWAHEAEWRIVAPLEQAKTRFIANGKEIYLFEIPALAIRRVIVGAKATREFVAKIKSLIEGRDGLSHIEMAQIRANLESHCLEVCPLAG